MLLKEFDYGLPLELIAQEPLLERDKSRLLVLHRGSGKIEHKQFADIIGYLNPGDLLVMNNTQVTARRLLGEKPTGGKVEALLLRNLGGNRWDSMVKPGRRVDVGSELLFGDGLTARVLERTESGGRIIDFGDGLDVSETINRVGQVPLPPYIQSILSDESRYQTVYASEPGSAAAPTAGFHFTPKLLAELQAKGIQIAYVTLHVGIATFRPVRVENISDHEMHEELISISPETADMINNTKGRVISVGTTTARVLESAAVAKGKVAPVDTGTNLFITPGYEFKILGGLITNFHMPKSTLLILISSLAGRELIMKAYKEAKEQKYRFLSFGDAMFIE